MQMNCELWYVGCLLSRDPKLKDLDFYDFGHVMLFKPPKELCFVFLFFFSSTRWFYNWTSLLIWYFICSSKFSIIRIKSSILWTCNRVVLNSTLNSQETLESLYNWWYLFVDKQILFVKYYKSFETTVKNGISIFQYYKHTLI